MTNTNARVIISTIVGLLFFAAVSTIHAQSFIIEGNGSGSNNSVNGNSTNNTSVNQTNQGNFDNSVKSKANTGDNTTDGNSGKTTIVTGNATTQTTIITEGNINKTNDPGCCKNSPTPTPTKKPNATPTPPTGGGGNPTPTPTSGPGGGNGGGGNPSNPSSSSNSSSSGVGGGQILGLSATAGDEPEQYLFYAFGSLCLGLATYVLTGRKSFER